MNRATGDISGLARSMAELGQLEPLLVSPVNRRWLIVAGHRRWRAALSLGWPELEATSLLASLPLDMIAAADNIARRDLTAAELAETVTLLLARSPIEVVSESLGLSPSYLRNLRRLRLDLAPDVWFVLKAEGSKASVARWLYIAAKSPEEQRKAIFQQKQGQLPPKSGGRFRRREVEAKISELPPNDPKRQALEWVLGLSTWPNAQS